MHALLTLIKKDGQFPSVWKAASLAALVEYELESSSEFSSWPDEGYSNSGRKLPIPTTLRDGYTEYNLKPVRAQDHPVPTFDALVRRLRRKYGRWTKPDSQEAQWLDLMADAWSVTLHPEEALRSGLAPEQLCREAAQRAGELEFAEKFLVPHLLATLKRPRP
jgi:hypothetical protein